MDNIYTLNIHEQFMLRAFELAKLGLGNVSPNPLVGCVLVKDGLIIGEGYHEKFGGDHAEVIAYKNAIQDPHGATAYITLEPCSIEGKTPPCTKLLIENGVSEVYIASLDPNPKINGCGVQELRNADITVHVGILEEESQKLNKGFFKWISSHVPYVITKVAQTKDGFMGLDSDQSVWITNDESKKHTHQIRSQVDAILIGRQTAMIDNPSLTVREVLGTNPKRVVVDTNRTLPLDLDIFNDNNAETIILCSEERFKASETSFCKFIPIKEINGILDPKHILQVLAHEGITSILIEGGAEILTSFKNEALIDEIVIYTSSKIIEGARLKNPLDIDDSWDITEKCILSDDSLIIAKRKVECLQEL
jgi:diaminohydroxyphosphoribosylaminopyrimidine deaminase/5-amino-6-(5-phosphoribosylamino)uracil reductase